MWFEYVEANVKAVEMKKSSVGVGVGVGVAACYKGKPKVQRFDFELK